MGDDYAIADIAIFPWVRNLVGFYGAGDLVGFADFAQVSRALATFMQRPAVARGAVGAGAVGWRGRVNPVCGWRGSGAGRKSAGPPSRPKASGKA